MKKIYFLFAVLFCSSVFGQIVNIPDAVFKAKLLSADVSNNIATDINYNNIKIDLNSNNEIEVSEALTVYNLFLSATPNQTTNLISNIDGIEAFENLKSLNVDFNNLTIVNVTSLSNLQQLHVSFTPLTSLSTNNLPNLKLLWCRSNQLTTLDISNLPNLEDFDCHGNQLTFLDLGNKPNLISIDCQQNNFSSLNINGLSNLQYLSISQNPLTSIDLSSINKIKSLVCMDTNVQTVNVTNQYNLKTLLVGNNPSLEYLFMKNGSYENSTNFLNLPNLKFVCVDTDNYLENINMQLLSTSNGNNFTVNSYCSFSPGGTFYTIQGETRYDVNNNGCDPTDQKKALQKFNISGANGTGSLIGNTTGQYSLPVQAGSHTITPVLENPTYFNISPASFTANFPTMISPLTQNFCMTANGNHNDLEIVIIPVNAARPGFVSEYKVLFKNKGTATQAGSFSFNYDDNLMNLLSTSLATSSQSFGVLNYQFTNLLPFQTRELTVKFTLNTPTATPPLLGGDILTYTAQINGATDETPLDNTFTLNQTVVNSFDPNDKTCLEGATIAQAKVGDYVHYLIRFENTGTANAENIVVKDIIDTAKYDINSLVAMNGSRAFVTRITNPNTVEFIFENIQLPFNDLYNDGYVSFKIKTKSTLFLGDSFSNTANIYFDYNAPIVTNTATTSVSQVLGTQETTIEKSLSFYPNPVDDFIHFKSDEKLLKLEIYDVSGRIIGSVSVQNNEANLSFLKTGNYLIKIFTKDRNYVNKVLKK